MFVSDKTTTTTTTTTTTMFTKPSEADIDRLVDDVVHDMRENGELRARPLITRMYVECYLFAIISESERERLRNRTLATFVADYCKVGILVSKTLKEWNFDLQGHLARVFADKHEPQTFENYVRTCWLPDLERRDDAILEEQRRALDEMIATKDSAATAAMAQSPSRPIFVGQ